LGTKQLVRRRRRRIYGRLPLLCRNGCAGILRAARPREKEKRQQREFGQRLIGARAWRAPLTPDRRELARQAGQGSAWDDVDVIIIPRLLTVILHHGRWRMLCRTLVCVGSVRNGKLIDLEPISLRSLKATPHNDNHMRSQSRGGHTPIHSIPNGLQHA
jgi:hypothetical protein